MIRKLIKFETMLDGSKIEPADEAMETAVEQTVHELDADKPADIETAENIHDALQRFGALSDAGAIKKIS